jgi:hypothetical protein
MVLLYGSVGFNSATEKCGLSPILMTIISVPHGRAIKLADQSILGVRQENFR